MLHGHPVVPALVKGSLTTTRKRVWLVADQIGRVGFNQIRVNCWVKGQERGLQIRDAPELRSDSHRLEDYSFYVVSRSKISKPTSITLATSVSPFILANKASAAWQPIATRSMRTVDSDG